MVCGLSLTSYIDDKVICKWFIWLHYWQIILVITTLFSYLTTLASIPSDINDEGFRCPCISLILIQLCPQFYQKQDICFSYGINFIILRPFLLFPVFRVLYCHKQILNLMKLFYVSINKIINQSPVYDLTLQILLLLSHICFSATKLILMYFFNFRFLLLSIYFLNFTFKNFLQ